MTQNLPSQFARFDNDFTVPTTEIKDQKADPKKQQQNSQAVTEADFDLKANFPKVVQQQPESVEQNEKDLLTGTILNELGINFKMILMKLKTSLPMVTITEEVSSYPEMLFGILMLCYVFIIGLFSRASLHTFIPLMFGSIIYGSMFFKFMVNLLLKGTKTVDFYSMTSAISYSLCPVLLTWTAVLFFKISFLSFIALSIPGCLTAAYILQKQIDAILKISDVKLLIAFPAAIYSAFWVLMGRGLAK